MRLAATALAAAAMVLAAGVPAASAGSAGGDRAATSLQSFTQFQSPSGNIGCVIGRARAAGSPTATRSDAAASAA